MKAQVLGLIIEASLKEASSCLLQGTVYSQDLGEASALRKTGQFCFCGLPKEVQRGIPQRVRHCGILLLMFLVAFFFSCSLLPRSGLGPFPNSARVPSSVEMATKLLCFPEKNSSLSKLKNNLSNSN